MILLVQVFEKKKNILKSNPLRSAHGSNSFLVPLFKGESKEEHSNLQGDYHWVPNLQMCAQKVLRAMTGSYGQDNTSAGHVIYFSGLCGNTLNWMDWKYLRFDIPSVNVPFLDLCSPKCIL